MKRSMKKAVLGTVLSASLCLAAMGPADACEDGQWKSGDFHQHTLYTDGSTTFDFAMEKNNAYGLDWWANSEHGGNFSTDGKGHSWTDPTYYPAGTVLGNNPGTGMWRWQSLRDFAFLDILETRSMYPKKRIFSGLEWNVPGHEHCSTSIVADDASAISAFEFQFDKSDKDTSRIGEPTPYGNLTKKNGRDASTQATKPIGNDRHADAVEAVKWMQFQYENGIIDNGWIIFAHIERAGVFKTGSSDGGYNVEHFRDFNNAAPDVCFGFEGAPGHQAEQFRGLGNTVVCDANNVCTSKDFGGTYGGVGYYTAKVGGLWDALLGEGRHWFNFANSDYHEHYTAGSSDFYPGEYQKNWVYVKDTDHNGRRRWDHRKEWRRDGDDSLNEIADGLRSGNSFFAMGDLINHLEFEAEGSGREANMGGELKARGDIRNLNLTIKFKSPKSNNCVVDGKYITSCAAPKVDHIDLIAGEITGKIDPASPDYTKATNDTTNVIATFTSKDWKTDREGNNVINYRIKKQDKNMYFRLRGTNLAPNTKDETDANGNPLPDALITLHQGSNYNPVQAAWNDLWFYSNPIFVYVD